MELTPEILLHGYSIGVFPMAEDQDDPEIFWVDPRTRGIIPLDEFHISRSLAKFMRNCPFEVSIDKAFIDVVDGCAAREKTWINDEIRDLYHQLYQNGYGHSVEIWENKILVGGVYGVSLGGAFFGESMFSKKTNASKVALACLIDSLNRGGYQLLDTQFITPHLASLGGTEISRVSYQIMLRKALETNGEFLTPRSPQELVQRKTQTS